jgi:protein gp37
MAWRLKARGNKKYQDVVDKNGWTGKGVFKHQRIFNVKFPQKPTTIFVCSMSDLYYELVDDRYIQWVYNVFCSFPQHTFIVCTKRPERIIPVLYESGYMNQGDSLKNVWHLTSIENQEWVDRRIPELLKLKEWGDWKIGLRIEPLIGPIDFLNCLPDVECFNCGWQGYKDNDTPDGGLQKVYKGETEWEEEWDEYDPDDEGIWICPKCHVPEDGNFGTIHREDTKAIGQILIGAESGPQRRECKLEWVRDILEQGREANIPCFVKQLHIDGKVSNNPEEWPEDLRVRELAWRADS